MFNILKDCILIELCLAKKKQEEEEEEKDEQSQNFQV